MTHLTHFLEVKHILMSQKRRPEDISKIEEAYLFAAKLHEGQYRISEEPYIIHPIEVAKILSELRMDTNTIIAAFLHDILEDTETQPEEIVENFGDDVLKLVQGVTKLGKYSFKSKEERQAENFRRMFIAMAEDVRIIFLKLADRLHNMRTLNYMAAAKQKRIAQETLDIFAPLANRLGIGKIKAELEDLSLRYIDPEKYYQIAKLVAQTKNERDALVNSLIEITKKHLEQNGVEAVIYGRAKHYYSIYNKMRRLNVSFDQLYDITAIRVIVNDEKDCYNALGIIHSQFKPIPGRFKDYIAMPKGNMYRSLHTSVIGLKNKPFEIQIRTKEMHEVAEYGLAAHWRYKESGSVKAKDSVDVKFNWMRKLIEISEDEKDAKEFVESVKLDLFSDQVFTFSPAGDVIDLPYGSTPVDFAYRIHTEVGHKTVGALVNGRIVQLDTKLQNGDIVEILTSKQCMPKIDWLDFVATKNASGKIRAWFKKYKREDNIEIGRANLENELTKTVFEELLKSGEFEHTAHEMNYKNTDDLFAAIGYGETTLRKVLNKVRRPKEEDLVEIDHQKQTYSRKKPSKQNDIIGLEGMMWSLAKCCSPIPGEPIVGVVTKSKGVSVHRLDCKCLFDIDPNRMMDIQWSDTISHGTYVAHLRIEAQERMGLLKDVLVKIADTNTNVSYAYSYSKNKKFGIIDIGIELSDVETLKKIVTNLQSMPDVFSVRRLQQKIDILSQRAPKKTHKSKPKKPQQDNSKQAK